MFKIYIKFNIHIASGTVYSMEWSPGVERWSGVLEWSGVKFWSEKVSCFAIHSDKARPYFRKYKEH